MDDPLIGKKLGNYVLLRKMGSGGMGDVYLGEHPEIGRQVAIKLLLPHLSHHPMVADRFVSEARVITRIDHQNVVDVYDFGRADDGQLYYVMELLKGRDLRQQLKLRSKMTAAELLPFVHQVCSALQAVHQQGIIHRDLKPENIFVLDREPLTFKILDFGIAKLLDGSESGHSMTRSGLVLGSPSFMAPEQAKGEPDKIGVHTDIYSLGVLLYRMLSGKRPFEADSAPLLLAKHVNEEATPLPKLEPSVPAPVAALVARCMAKEPEDRPLSAAHVARAYVDAVGTGPHAAMAIPAIPAPWSKEDTTMASSAGEVSPGRTGLPARRYNLRYFAIGLFVLAIGIVGLLVFGLGDSLPDPTAKTPPSTKPTRENAASSPINTPEPLAHDVVVKLVAGEATCHYRFDEFAMRKASTPCKIRVPEGSLLELKVERQGYAAFDRRWKIDGPKTMTLVPVESTKRLVEAGAKVEDTTETKTAKHTLKRPPRRRRPRAGKKKLPPTPTKAAKPSKKKSRYGAGTMPF